MVKFVLHFLAWQYPANVIHPGVASVSEVSAKPCCYRCMFVDWTATEIPFPCRFSGEVGPALARMAFNLPGLSGAEQVFISAPTADGAPRLLGNCRAVPEHRLLSGYRLHGDNGGRRLSNDCIRPGPQTPEWLLHFSPSDHDHRRTHLLSSICDRPRDTSASEH